MQQRDGRSPVHPSRHVPGVVNSSVMATPFARLAKTHAVAAAGDAVVATALAGSLFFTLPAGQARGPVLKYLVLTMLPFAIMAPLIGPAIDRIRSGHRYVIILTTFGRATLAFVMISHVQGQSPVFFLEALGFLVLQKGYQVARSALVPTVVRNDDELVEANSKLSLISGLMGFAGAVPGALLLKLGDARWTLGLGSVVFLVATAFAGRLPATVVAPEQASSAERQELRSAGIVLAASGMALLRGIVGFLTLLLAFDFRGGDKPTWQFAVVVATAVAGGLLGAVLAPRIRAVATEERMLTGSLAVTAAMGVLALVVGGVKGASVLALTVGVAASTGKLAFDSIVQRDAPDANRGRSFARFETRFQLAWVIGALVPVAATIPASIGFLAVTLLAAFATFSYVVGRLAARHRSGDTTPVTARAAEIEERLDEVQGRLKVGAREAVRSVAARARDRISGRPTAPEDQGESRQPPPLPPEGGAAPPRETPTEEAPTRPAPPPLPPDRARRR